MKNSSIDVTTAKALEWISSVSGELKKALGKTHEAKVKIISQADDMSSEEKLEALDNNDYQLLYKIGLIGVGVLALLDAIRTGKTINLEQTKQQIAA